MYKKQTMVDHHDKNFPCSSVCNTVLMVCVKFFKLRAIVVSGWPCSYACMTKCKLLKFSLRHFSSFSSFVFCVVQHSVFCCRHFLVLKLREINKKNRDEWYKGTKAKKIWCFDTLHDFNGTYKYMLVCLQTETGMYTIASKRFS